MRLGQLAENEMRPYICVHATKGKHECHADSSYGAAKKAAAHWKLKSTAGIDTHLADVEKVAEGFKIRDKSRGYGVSDKTYKTRAEAKDAAVMKSASSGGDWEVIEEKVAEAGGYYTQPVYDMIEKHGYERVMHELLTSLDADVIQSFLQRANFED